MKKISILLLCTTIILSSCGIYKRSDVKDNPVNVNERVQRNIKEGKGIRFGSSFGKSGGTFDFASSNSMWRASIEILDFVTFTNASYSGGLIVTDWFNANTDNSELRDLKITVKFLSNEIRADGLVVNVHERICKNNSASSCQINKIKSKISSELKIAILKKAVQIEKNIIKENVEDSKIIVPTRDNQ